MRIEKCWYCSGNIYPGHGRVFVRNDAKVFRFCRSKCFSHFNAKHNPKKSKWTMTSRQFRGKELLNDAVLRFESQRNAPLRYNRNLYIKTVQAMQKIEAIKAKRRLRLYQTRMRVSHKESAESRMKQLSKHSHVLKNVQKAVKLTDARREQLIQESKEKRLAKKVALQQQEENEVSMN